MAQNPQDFDLYLPSSSKVPEMRRTEGTSAVQKFSARLQPGGTQYDIAHRLGSRNVMVQTRIAGNVREGGISIVDENTVRLSFGGPLHEEMDVVIIG